MHGGLLSKACAHHADAVKQLDTEATPSRRVGLNALVDPAEPSKADASAQTTRDAMSLDALKKTSWNLGYVRTQHEHLKSKHEELQAKLEDVQAQKEHLQNQVGRVPDLEAENARLKAEAQQHASAPCAGSDALCFGNLALPSPSPSFDGACAHIVVCELAANFRCCWCLGRQELLFEAGGLVSVTPLSASMPP